MQRTILVADDSSTIRRIIELSLQDSDLRVEAVSTGNDALARLDTLRPDLVLADVGLSDLAGYDLCRTIKTSPRPVPVLLLTGSFDPFDRERARDSGADGHLVKPFDSSVLRERVLALLREPVLAQAVREAPAPAADPLPALTAPPESLPPAAWVDAVAREVVARLSAEAVREIAREIVPRLARELIRERIRELEARDDD